jgi:hypothetical protein
MRKAAVVMTTFALAFVIGLGLATMFANDTHAKPQQCVLAIEPFYYCEPHPSCHNPGEQKCWECLGMDLNNEPCLCTRVGCMVPPE